MTKGQLNKLFQATYDEAHQAGVAAVEAATITPMVVVSPEAHGQPARNYFVADGVCGFASIIVQKGNSKFANWLKANGLGRYSEYQKAVTIWVSGYGQSLQKKEAYAHAFAKVLNEKLPQDTYKHIWVSSRLD